MHEMVNSALLLFILFGGALLWLQLRRATPLAMRAEVDRLVLDYGQYRRQQAMLQREQERLGLNVVAVDGRVNEVHERITIIDEALNVKFEALQESMSRVTEALSSLACSERNWHTGEKPGFCPLHQKTCPLNGVGEIK